jgi:hypothetical protein
MFAKEPSITHRYLSYFCVFFADFLCDLRG